jgi:zinc protease
MTCLLTLVVAAAVGSAGGGATTLTDATVFQVNGLRVIHQPKPGSSSIVAVHLYFLGGARQVDAGNAGIEPFLLQAAEYGTRSYPGIEARRAMARTGSRLSVAAESDWTVFSFHGLKQEFDSSFAVFADQVMHPTLDSASMAIVRARMLAGIASRTMSPGSHVFALAESLALKNHPYAHDPRGTMASVQALTADGLRSYAREHLVKSRMLLVVVGDVPRSQVEAAVDRTIGTLPMGDYQWKLPPPSKASSPAVVAAGRQVHTNYILGYISGPSRASPEWPAFMRAMHMLSGWISYEVREKSTLSYAAYVDVIDRGAPGAVIYMSTTQPDSAIRIVNRIIREFENEVTIPRTTLRRAAQRFASGYVFATGDPSSHAGLLARAYLYDGDHSAASRLVDVMGRIAFPDLRRAVRTYAKNIQYAYIGDTTRFTPDEFTRR